MCRQGFIKSFEPRKKTVMQLKKKWKYTTVIAGLAIILVWKMAMADGLSPVKNLEMNNQLSVVDHSNKSILARGCDPVQSLRASQSIPPLIGNPEYVPTTNDNDFIEKLESRQWSVIFFAPGACRYSAAKRAIPGADQNTKNWTLEQYRELVRELQGEEVQIVETMDERETLGLLKKALSVARETKK